MFSILPQNSQPPSAIKSKRQAFRNQIRRQQINDYKSKIRKKKFFDNEVDHNILKNINLIEAMHTILNYNFPRINVQGEEIEIDNCHVIYDLEREENAPLQQALHDLFLYMTSSKSRGHAINLIEQGHIFKLAEMLDRKASEMKPYFKEKSYKEHKTADDLRMPQIYQKVLIILTVCSYEHTLFFQESIKYIIHVLMLVMGVFPRQTKVIEACAHSFISAMDRKDVLDYLLMLLNDEMGDECVLTKMADVMIFQGRYLSRRLNIIKKIHNIQSGLLQVQCAFGKRFFSTSNSMTCFRTWYKLIKLQRRQIYKSFERLLTNKEITEELESAIVTALLQLYNTKFGNTNQIFLESCEVFYAIVDCLKDLIREFKENKIKEMRGQKLSMSIKCFIIIETVFDQADPDDEYYEEVIQLLNEELENQIDPILQDTLKLIDKPLIIFAVQLTKVICKWGCFMEKIYQNSNILIRLFQFCSDESFKLKKQAICCICNIIEGYFEGNSYHDSELVQIYEQIVERFKFLDIIVENLETHSDIDLNIEILKCIRILCYFWQSDPELGKYNRFWIKFIELNGDYKLKIITSQDRNEKMQNIAEQLLNQFVLTETYEVEI